MDREILFRGKRSDTQEWVEGYYVKRHGVPIIYENAECPQSNYEVQEETLCKCAGLIAGKEIWENYICLWVDSAYGKCTGVVRYGEWEQDGSGGEYGVTKCLGWYLEVTKVQSLMPDVYTDAEAEEIYPEWWRTISLVDAAKEMSDFAVIGNIFDNPELLKEYE